MNFGNSKNAGARHLRIGWKNALAVGTVLTRGNVSVSVLKPGANYPGNPGDKADWIRCAALETERRDA